jgi:hypothetical protein
MEVQYVFCKIEINFLNVIYMQIVRDSVLLNLYRRLCVLLPLQMKSIYIIIVIYAALIIRRYLHVLLNVGE